MIRWLKRVFTALDRCTKKHRCIDCGAMKPVVTLTCGRCEMCMWAVWKKEADDRMRSLSIRAPVTDWDVAQAFEKPESDPSRVEYRFLGVTGEEDA